jgi:ubiquinone/menaquinone biosynthesis C-methylase UbiE
LGDLIGENIILVHADATSLAFDDELFDGFWTVQTFQHIPDFKQACFEAHRVLKQGGYFINFSLHITPIINIIYRLLGKSYHKEGKIEGLFYLNKASDQQKNIISEIFGCVTKSYYTECLFHPDLKFTITGSQGSWLGWLDASLGRSSKLRMYLARQRSFETVK